MPLIAEPRAAFGPPVPLLDLGSALREQGIACCHWKGHEKRERWATGRGDIDLLVDRAGAARFHALAARSGFREAVPPGARTIPGLADYIGPDPATGVLLRLHVHYRLVLGRFYTVRYRLPLEQPVLGTAVPAQPFPVPAPEWALILEVLRAALQPPGRGAPPIEHAGMADALEAVTESARVATALERHFPALPYARFEACLRALIERDAERWRREAALLRKRLAPLREAPPPAALAAAAAGRLRTLARRRGIGAGGAATRPRGRKRLASGGAVVALVGGDGAGKSTAAAALEEWLARELRVLRVHAGRPPRSLATLAAGALLKLVRWLTWRRADSSAVVVAFRMLRSLCTARDRLRLCQTAGRFAARGGIVIAERYPLRHEASLAGPVIRALANGRRPGPLVRLLIRAEEDLYDRIPPPDAVVLLRVTPEVAAARKTDEPADYVLERNRLVVRADWNGARAVDADRPFAEVLSELREVVWNAL